MKIGRIVKNSAPAIFKYCEDTDPKEFTRLQDPEYSKVTFDINFPFCRQVAQIGEADRMRYWNRDYVVQNVTVCVTSQWYNPPTSKSLPLLHRYLVEKGLAADFRPDPTISGALPPERASSAARGRFKGNAIGNAQNYLVRNILSRLGEEQFSAKQWQAVVHTFGKSCAYCGAKGSLVMDHIVPINRQSLGEHRLGNLAPSCHDCNSRKAEKDFRWFLANSPNRIAAIERHMKKQGYEPIGDHAELRAIIERAHQEVRDLADRYVTIINNLLTGKSDAVE